MVLLTEDILRNLAKAKGIPEETGGRNTGSREGSTVALTAVNAAGPASNSVTLNLAFDFIVNPATPPIEVLEIREDGKTRTIRRRAGEVWPSEAYQEKK